ncbi:response regulator transcription factor [Nocardioides marinquilinus]|uniref:Response regulator transcription factor n=1 Tax=Nocardioides marinquilinus TaxID=1210400 RepID=A0ABP9P830_9ACTN
MTVPATARSQMRVLIVDDHALFAESLELALSLEGYDVRRNPPGVASSSVVLSQVRRMRPRVVLLDLDLGPMGDGARLVHPIASTGANVVIVTSTPDRARWGECIRHGARQVLTKTQPLNEILSVVRRIGHGLPVLTAETREELLLLWHQRRQESGRVLERLELLSAREQEVLGLLMSGQPVREIARLGFVSEATVRTQVKSVLSKLEVSSQLTAVGIAHQVGWRPPSR